MTDGNPNVVPLAGIARVDDLIAEIARVEEVPLPQIDDRTVDALIRVLAHQSGVPVAEAARSLLRGLARWFGIDFEREAADAVPAESREG